MHRLNVTPVALILNRIPYMSVAGDVITKDDVFDVMEQDLAVADMVLWVGISFEQSASTSYFRRVSPGYLPFFQ